MAMACKARPNTATATPIQFQECLPAITPNQPATNPKTDNNKNTGIHNHIPTALFNQVLRNASTAEMMEAHAQVRVGKSPVGRLSLGSLGMREKTAMRGGGICKFNLSIQRG